MLPELLVIIPEGNKRHFFKNEDIVWIKADKYYVTVHTIKKRFLIRITMKKLSDILPSNFIRINKSTLINIFAIRLVTKNKVNSTVTLRNNLEINLSTVYCENFEELIG